MYLLEDPISNQGDEYVDSDYELDIELDGMEKIDFKPKAPIVNPEIDIKKNRLIELKKQLEERTQLEEEMKRIELELEH